MKKIIINTSTYKSSKEDTTPDFINSMIKSLNEKYDDIEILVFRPMRDFYEDVYDAVLDSGAPGVRTNFGVMLDSGSELQEQQQNEEWALVYTSVGPDNVDNLRQNISDKISSLDLDRFAFYTLPIPRALTYLGG